MLMGKIICMDLQISIPFPNIITTFLVIMHNNKELFDWINNNFHYPIKANFHRANICTVENCIAGSPDQFVSNK